MDNEKLKRLIIENPDLPIKIKVSSDKYKDIRLKINPANYTSRDYLSTLLTPTDCGIEELALYDESNDVWLDKNDLKRNIEDLLMDDFHYAGLPDYEFDKKVEEFMDSDYVFQKCIVIYVS